MKIKDLVKLEEIPKSIKKLIGKKINRLTVQGFVGKYKTAYFVDVLCDCGTEKIVTIANLVYGTTHSCGCKNLENQVKRRNESRRKNSSVKRAA